MYRTALLLMIGLAIGNFLAQFFFTKPKWGEAIERTFFQWLAIALYAFCLAYLRN